jgi:hypothetical protein
MNIRRIIPFLFLVLFTVPAVGQYMTNRKNRALVDFKQYKYGGWMTSPGLTYMYPSRVKYLADSTEEPIKYRKDPNVNPNGRIALYLEVGRYQIFYNGGRILNYMDYSLAYKRLSGTEKYSSTERETKAIFKQNFLLANFNVNNIIQLTDYTFIQNSIGVNFDWKFSEKHETNDSPYAVNNSGTFVLSLHYKLGYGVKITDQLFIIPTLETPILNGLKWENGKSTYGIFSSRYRPIIFSVRFAWLRIPSRGDCPPVYGPDGDADKQQQHMMGQ